VISAMYYHSHILPWTVIVEEVKQFRKILKLVFIVFIIAGVVIPFIPVPKVDLTKPQEIPPRLAKLILEKKPKPKPVVEAPKKLEKKEKKKEEKKVEKKEKPKPKPKPKVEKKKEPPKKPVVDLAKVRAQARKKAANSGLLAMMDDMSDLREVPALNKNVKLNKSATKAQKTTAPQLLTSNIKRSGGISSSALQRATTQRRTLGGRTGTEIDSPVDASAAEAFADASNAERTSPRTLEEVQLIFDRNKGAITRMYNRALRKDPSLRGIVLLEITITPGGDVVACKAVSSDFDAPDLVRKLVVRVKAFKFKAKDVEQVTIRYPLDFTPAS